MHQRKLTRRGFLQGSAAAVAAVTIVPPHVLGAQAGRPPGTAPSETFGGALIGCGGRGGGTFGQMKGMGLNVVSLARCDVKFKDTCDNKTIYTDFRRVVERKDIDIIAIATPPHWHALISIAAMEAGKDVLCEKPMTRFVAEGRAVAQAEKRYKRIFQVGTFGRFGMARQPDNIQVRKILTSGLLKQTEALYVAQRNFKVKEWSGKIDLAPEPPPANLDWDMYCGPSTLAPYVKLRTGMTHRGYWDYDGGGLGDMGQHYMDPLTWQFGLDGTAPVEIEASAPPAHPVVAGMWAWAKLKYANGFTLVLESREWGEPSGLASKGVSLADLSSALTDADKAKLKEMPDPRPLVPFGEAVKTRQPAGGNADAAHRTVCIMHLANIAIRMGRKIRFDPVTEQVIGDEEANRLVNQPMRAPWHL
jgi:predicted dehydrogenase